MIIFGCFLKLGYPKMNGLYRKLRLKWMIWGYPILHRKSPCSSSMLRFTTPRDPWHWKKNSPAVPQLCARCHPENGCLQSNFHPNSRILLDLETPSFDANYVI